MKTKLFTAVLCVLSASAYGQGQLVRVTNPDAQPVPVKIVEGSAGGGSAAPANTVTTTTPSNYVVTTTSGTALAANANRKDAVLVNYGSVGCFLARGATAAVGQGIYLAPGGGSYNIDANNLYKGIITAITASGTTTLAISEGQ